MERNTKIFLGLAAGAALLTGFAYYRAAKQLQFHLQNVQFMPDGKLHVTLHVQNNSGFGFPVPMLDLGAFDTNDNYLGTIQSNILQYIPAGGGLIEGIVLPNYNSIFTTLTNYAMGTLPANILLQGNIRVGNLTLPIQTSVISGPKVSGTQKLVSRKKALSMAIKDLADTAHSLGYDTVYNQINALPSMQQIEVIHRFAMQEFKLHPTDDIRRRFYEQAHTLYRAHVSKVSGPGALAVITTLTPWPVL